MSTSGQDPAAVQLPEQVRRQLLDIAADVLGRLAVEQTPVALRAIAKFSSAKRARLAGPQLLAALDADEAFRAKVGEAVVDASSLLADAVRDGSSTAASAPLDVAIVAYLTRPPGWADALRAALDRWREEQGHTDVAAEQVQQLRSELAALRAQAKSEPARMRAAVNTALAQSTADLAALRGQLKSRLTEVRTAERARDQAQVATERVTQSTQTSASAHAAQVRRLKARISELECAVDAARREQRVDRDVDNARLWLLVGSIADAAAGLRRELSLPSPTVLPGDTLQSGETARGSGQGRSITGAAALERVLALPHVHLVVDGYNVTKTGYGELPLIDQRTRLISSMAALASRVAVEITIAFDGAFGAAGPAAQPPVPRGVRVLFSAADEIADDLIRRLVSAEAHGRTIVVVTTDQQIVTDVRRMGAWTAPSSVLLARIG
ncbi:MAG: NYN domain-containing protein [Jatrophihabitantaceae bacterium]